MRNEKPSKDESPKHNEKKELSEEELKALSEKMKSMKNDPNQNNNENQNNKNPKQRLIMIEFAGRFHHNGLLNLIVYFLINLIVIYTLVELFGEVDFSGELTPFLLFVAVYTTLEMMFRNFVTVKWFKVVMRTFGFIFFFGYVTIFYVLENYVFATLFNFNQEALFIVFMVTFLVLRYIMSHVIRNVVLKRLR